MVLGFHIEKAGIANVKRIRTNVLKARRSIRTAQPAFRKIDREIDTMIRDNFQNLEGGGVPWPELSDWTESARFREEGWYANPPTADDIGRWTQSMFQGLLGRGENGQKIMTPLLYERRYLGDGNEGPETGARAQEFHQGRGGRFPQPARPFWGPLERTRIARRHMRAYYKEKIAGRFL